MKDTLLNSSDPNTWLLQGNLLRFKPGFSGNYIAKWCTASKTCFAYYRDKWAANCFFENPLQAIPINQIKYVKRVQLEIPEYSKKAKGKNKQPMNLQFEIVMHDNLSLPNTVEDAIKHATVEDRTAEPSIYGQQENHLMRSPYKLQTSVQDLGSSNVSVAKDCHWSSREMEWYMSENRFLFVAETPTDLQKWLIVMDWILVSQ